MSAQAYRTCKHRVDQLESVVDLLSNLSSGQDDLAADKYQKDDFGLDHTVNETREQLWLVRAKVVMAASKTLEADGELDIARANDVLDLEIRELCVEPKLLNDPSVFPRR